MRLVWFTRSWLKHSRIYSSKRMYVYTCTYIHKYVHMFIHAHIAAIVPPLDLRTARPQCKPNPAMPYMNMYTYI